MTCYMYAIGPYNQPKKPILKIGIANDVQSRFRNLQIGSPVELKIYSVWEYPSKTHARFAERFTHDRFRNKNSHGEWFFITLRELENLMNRDMSLDKMRFGFSASFMLVAAIRVDPEQIVTKKVTIITKEKTITKKVNNEPEEKVFTANLSGNITSKSISDRPRLPKDSPIRLAIIEKYRRMKSLETSP